MIRLQLKEEFRPKDTHYKTWNYGNPNTVFPRFSSKRRGTIDNVICYNFAERFKG